MLLADLAQYCHLVTRLKVAGALADNEALAEAEKREAETLSGELSLGTLSRLWQMLIRGYDEVASAPKALAAAEMVLIRIAHAAQLPDPEELNRALASLQSQMAEGGGPASSAPASSASPSSDPSSALTESWAQEVLTNDDDSKGEAPKEESSKLIPLTAPASPPNETSAKETSAPSSDQLSQLEDLLALAETNRDLKAKRWLRYDIRFVSLEPGKLSVSLTEDADPALIGQLSKRLTNWTGERWVVVLAKEGGGLSLAEQENKARQDQFESIKEDANVRKLLDVFPEAKLIKLAQATASEASADNVIEMPTSAKGA
ncbi:hypothetical protein CAPTEDRAFT_207840 [Capitella teleta]|uniref:DNA polymerase III gamma subunit domain-containing protein n=1 Tax=Capitella teleta TaxID=283909 RepID=R7U6G8_CAPTE|nr:hypothetical protein CAPTEDRAFT_207840 [Capitella teleta]|eukprot:ELU01920.1 hypothetical protein CAPTEDRAFT_207840 [Capitella teleta]